MLRLVELADEGPFTELFTLKFSKKQKERLDARAKKENTSIAEVIRNASDLYTGNDSQLILALEESEWEYLKTIATNNDVDAATALKKIMLGYYILLNMPLSKSIKNLGDLEEEFDKMNR